MIKFRSSYDSTVEFVSEPGSPYLDQYEFEFDEKGEVKGSSLHKTDNPLNVQDKIQADYPSTDINLLMKKFALGDTSALNVKEGIYADVTKMPTNFAEFFERVNETRRLFDGLPADVKSLFDNSYEEFWSEYGTEDFNKKIEAYNDRFVDHSFEDAELGKESEVGIDE